MAIVKHLNQVRELTVSIKTSVSFLNLCVWAGGFCRKVCKSVPMLMKDGKSFLKKKSGSKVHGGRAPPNGTFPLPNSPTVAMKAAVPDTQMRKLRTGNPEVVS